MTESARSVVVLVAEPPHLCRLQAATRDMCRSLGQNEAVVFEAVIAVTELAHRLFIEPSRCGEIELAGVRLKDRFSLEVRAEDSGFDGSPRPPVSACLSFLPGAASRLS